MIKEIRKFYNLTKNKRRDEEVNNTQQEHPFTFVHIFHKEYPRFQSINLPKCKLDKELERLFRKRKSTREFSNKPLNLEQLSRVLSSCRILVRDEEFERRTYPSAGARFPIEIYPLSFNIENLKSGVYHYNMLNNTLELIWDNDLKKYSTDIVSTFISNPSAALIMTSVISRSEIKYQYKAYPFSLLETGHMGQNIYLACAKYNIGCCGIGGFIDNSITKILDITQDEMILYAFALGNLT